jgi:hypothetical protein
VCALLTDYDAVRMYDTKPVEQFLGVTIGDRSRSCTLGGALRGVPARSAIKATARASGRWR